MLRLSGPRAGTLPGFKVERTTYFKNPPMVRKAPAFFVRFWEAALRSLCVAWSDRPARFVRCPIKAGSLEGCEGSDDAADWF